MLEMQIGQSKTDLAEELFEIDHILRMNKPTTGNWYHSIGIKFKYIILVIFMYNIN